MVRRSARSTKSPARSDMDWWPKAHGVLDGALPSTKSVKKPRLAMRHTATTGTILAHASPRDSTRIPSVLPTLQRHRSYDRQSPAPFTASSRRKARVHSLFRARLSTEVPPRAISSLSQVASEPPPLKHIVACGQPASRRCSIANQQGEKHLAGWGEWEREFRARAEELASVTKVKGASRLG